MPASGSRSSAPTTRAGSSSRRRRRWPPASRRGGPSRGGARPCPRVISSVTLTGDLDAARLGGDAARRRRRRARAARRRPGCTRSAWVRPPRMSSGALCIHELCERSSRRPIRRSGKSGSWPLARGQPVDLGADLRRVEVHAPRRWRTLRVAARRSAMCSSRTTPWGCARSRATLRPPRRRPNQVALRAGAQQQVDAGGAGVIGLPEPSPSRRSSLASGGRDRRAAGEVASMTVHSSRASPRGLDDRVGALDERRRVEAEEGERQVLALEEGRRRQHVVGVAVGLVDVEVERDEQVEVGRARARARRRRAPRGPGLPAETNSARIWPSPGVVDLAVHQRRRQRRRARRGSRRCASASVP